MTGGPDIYSVLLKADITNRVKQQKIRNPTFVAGYKKAINVCKDLATVFHSNYAYIREEQGNYGPQLVLYGRVNPNAILFIKEGTPSINLLDDYDLIKCAGAKNIYYEQTKSLYLNKIHRS